MLKQFIKRILIALRIDLTKNIHYDRLTLRILDKVLEEDSNCIDIGCHKGEILDEILKRSPKGFHYGFEPIPVLFNNLKVKFNLPNVRLLDIALSDTQGETTFNYVVNAPAYSGLRKREYAVKEPAIEEIEVRLDMLDAVLPADYKVDLIKLDVEGAEFNVLKGARQTLMTKKPAVIFEFGLGASDHYGISPEVFFQYLSDECGYGIFLLDDFLKKKNPLKKAAFVDTYNKNTEYYFIASPL
jgi:FkbM family methyltransferase